MGKAAIAKAKKIAAAIERKRKAVVAAAAKVARKAKAKRKAVAAAAAKVARKAKAKADALKRKIAAAAKAAKAHAKRVAAAAARKARAVAAHLKRVLAAARAKAARIAAALHRKARTVQWKINSKSAGCGGVAGDFGAALTTKAAWRSFQKAYACHVRASHARETHRNSAVARWFKDVKAAKASKGALGKARSHLRARMSAKSAALKVSVAASKHSARMAGLATQAMLSAVAAARA